MMEDVGQHHIGNRAITYIVLFLVAGFGLGWLVRGYSRETNNVPPDSKILRLGSQETYKYINPLLACELSEKKESEEFAPLKKKFNDIIGSAKTERKLDSIGIYFRELASGRWVGINQEGEYAGGSLHKVPLMIAYFKLAESQPDILSKTLTFNSNEDANDLEYIKQKGLTPLVKGRSYTIDELIRRMIVYSDNNAADLLLKNIDINLFTEVFTDLTVPIPGTNYEDSSKDLIAAKTYSLFFRILYNATYLTKSLSEKALDLLAEADFPEGLMAGLPPHVMIADKFGEKTLLQSSDSIKARELHDCGIIYHSVHPYFLCVMTRGGDFNDLSNVIQSISRVTYDTIDSLSAVK
jgi:beta-lactamase class A